MPYMTDSPLQNIKQLLPGRAEYLFGTFNYTQSASRMLISQVAVAANVVTLTVQVVEGPIPVLLSGLLAVTGLISVNGTQSAGGALNVNRAAVTAVNISSAGSGTISYAVTTGNIAATADFGTAIVDVQEIPDALTNGYSIPICLQAQPAQNEGLRNLTVETTFPSLPTTAAVLLYVAQTPWKTKFVTTGVTIATVSGGAQSTAVVIQVAQGNYPYLCAVVSSAAGGTNPSIICKVSS
jgi:hypothetical protein